MTGTSLVWSLRCADNRCSGQDACSDFLPPPPPQQALERYAHTPGHAQAFATVCKAIFSDDDILQCVLFNCDLHQLLSPLQHYVDNFKSDDEFASG